MNSLFTEDKLLNDISFLNKNVYILALKNSEEYILIKGHFKMLYNDMYKKKSYIIEKELIEKYNDNNFKLEDIEIVIPKLNILHTDLKDYLELFQEKTLHDIIKLYILLDYYNNENNPIIYNKLNNVISELEYSNYWCNKNKCNLNINKEFMERTFKLNYDKGEIADNIKKVLDNININHTSDYNEIINDYIDISNGVKNKSIFYNIHNNKTDITKEQINELFTNLNSEYLKYTLFNRIALSIKYTHLVVNNEYILDLMKDIFKKFLPIYKYIFGYIWLYYSINEKIKYNLSVDDINIFTRDTASKLPDFPMYYDDIHMNPYITICVSKKILRKKNFYGLKYICGHDYSIATQKEFQENLNIFISGNKDKDIFSGLNWDNTTISGSIMTACSLKNNPLLNNFKHIEDISERKKRFYNEYYAKSDIDIMCDAESSFDYIDKSNEINDCIKKNLEEVNNEEVKIDNNISKKLTVLINRKNIVNYLPLYSLEELENKKNTNEIKEIFYKLYINNKTDRNSIYRKTKPEKDYEEFYKFIDINNIKLKFTDDIKKYDDKEISYYISNNDDIYIKYIEIIKYKKESKHLKHNIEYFNIYYNNITAVNRFHLGCVRSSINHLTTASITSYKTNLNLDYNYFDGMIDQMEILIKNLIRGQGCLLNDIEKNCLKQYIKNTKWNDFFNINNYELFSSKKINNSIYKPRRYLPNDYKECSPVDDVYYNNDLVYIETYDDFENEYKRICGYDNKSSNLKILNKKTINDDGNVNPIDWNFIEMAYHELKN